MPLLFVSGPTLTFLPPEEQLAPAASVVTDTKAFRPLVPLVPFVPFVPLAPLHTYCVFVTSDGSRMPLPLVSIPAWTVIPPFGQTIRGAVFCTFVATEYFPETVAPPDVPPPPPLQAVNRMLISVADNNVLVVFLMTYISLWFIDSRETNVEKYKSDE